MLELTVFINVKIANLKELSKSIFAKVNNEVSIKRDKIKITIVKKYLLISLKSKLILANINLFIKIFLGLLNDKIWLMEYLNNEKILINLKPELVEKKDPPIITKIKNIKVKLDLLVSIDIPILDMLLDTESKLLEKSLLKLKKRKKIVITTIK